MPVVCPGCETELDPSNTHCPVCLRQRSRKEIMEGLRGKKESAGGRGRWLFWLFLLAVGCALHLYSLELKRRRKPAVASPAVQAPAAEAPPPVVTTPDGRRGPTVTVLSQIVPNVSPAVGETARAGDPYPSERSGAQERAKPARKSAWAVAGMVYDLISLKPVPGVRLVFQDRDSGKAFTAKTGPDGRYRVSLPKLRDGGYELTVSHLRYGGSYLEEMSPPYRRQSAERRREAAEQLSASEVLHVPLLPEFEQDEVPYDLVLFSGR